MKSMKTIAAVLLLTLFGLQLPVYGIQTEGVALTSEAFPDPSFLSWAKRRAIDQDGILSQKELDAVTDIDLRKQGIKTLEGIG